MTTLLEYVIRMDDGVPCGRGWVGTKPGCKRKKKGEGMPSAAGEVGKSRRKAPGGSKGQKPTAEDKAKSKKPATEKLEELKTAIAQERSKKAEKPISEKGSKSAKAGKPKSKDADTAKTKSSRPDYRVSTSKQLGEIKSALEKKGGQSKKSEPRVSGEDLLSAPNPLGRTNSVLPEPVKKRIQSGELGSIAAVTFNKYESVSFGRDEQKEAKAYAQLNADRINYLSSPPPVGGANLHGAEKFREGSPIKNQKAFDTEYSKVYDTLKKGEKSSYIPIYKIRRSLGDRVSRKDFDEFLKNSSRKPELLEESVEDGNVTTKFLDGVATAMGKPRMYVFHK